MASDFDTEIQAPGGAITGTDGNDRIIGSTGNDTATGGAGDDQFESNGGSVDVFNGGDGNDTHVANADGGIQTFNGGNQDDILRVLAEGLDQIFNFNGGEGIDILELDLTQVSLTDAFFSLIRSGSTFFLELFESGNVGLVDVEFFDLFLGDNGNVVDLPSQFGAPRLRNVDGGAGDDVISGASGIVNGEGGADEIVSFSGTAELNGGEGDDTLTGFGAVDGGADDDTITTSVISGSTVDGGTGTDTLTVSVVERDRVSVELDPTNGTRITGEREFLTQQESFFDNIEELLIAFNPGNRQNVTFNFGAGLDDLDVAINLQESSQSVTEPVTFNFTVDGDIPSEGLNIALNDNEAGNVLEGGDGGESLNGNGGDDTLNGNGGDDTLTGGAGDDSKDGGDGDDLLVWNDGDGDDILNGGDGTDGVQIVGDDSAGDAFTVSIEDGGRVQFNRANLGDFQLDIGQVEEIGAEGGGGDDTFTAENDDFGDTTLTFNGGDGDDSAEGSAGGDGLYGDDGRDILNGNDGDDTLTGGKGDDTKEGGDGNDLFVINDGDGNDLINGGDGDDRVQITGDAISGDLFTASTGNDGTVQFNRQNLGLFQIDLNNVEAVDLFAGAGDDTFAATDNEFNTISLTFNGGDGNDSAEGGDGDDALFGDLGLDILNGNDGDDTLTGGAGDDTKNGGDGNDVLVWNEGDGNDELIGGDGTDRAEITGDATADNSFLITVESPSATVETPLFEIDIKETEEIGLKGGEGDDDLAVDAAQVLDQPFELAFDGGDGEDRAQINGDDGAGDLFAALAGDDGDLTLKRENLGLFEIDLKEVETIDIIAGDGDDTFTVEDEGLGETTLFFLGEDGRDRLEAFVNNDTGALIFLNVNDGQNAVSVTTGEGTVTAQDTEEIAVTGGEGNDTFSAEGEELPTLVSLNVNGENGDDELTGSESDDTLTGGAGDDNIAGRRGDDDVAGGLGDDTLAGGLGEDLVQGDEGNDLIRGNVGEDTLIGGAGNDQIRGQKNADLIEGNAGDDNLKGGGGNDTLLGGDGNDFLNGGTRADLINGGAGTDILIGRAFSDTLIGGDGNDRLNGGGEEDRLIGGGGDDFLKGGAQADVFVFDVGFGTDRLVDFNLTEDRLEISQALANGQSTTQLAALAQQSDTGVDITFTTGDTLRLLNLTDTNGLAGQIDIV